MRPTLHTAAASAALLALGGCAGSSEKREIEGAVQTLFDAINTRDADLAATVLVPEGALVAVWQEDDGTRRISPTNHAQWMGALESYESTLFEEFTGDPLVIVEGDVAVVWGEYRFEIDGELSHTGIDAITLVRTDEGWKIAGGAYSRITPDQE